MAIPRLSFVTPYLVGADMMRLHLSAIRGFHPEAPILVSAKSGTPKEMEGYAAGFGIRYWIEDCDYHDAVTRLLERCDTEYVCILDHDAVLLSSLDPLLEGLVENRYDLVGVEERIRVPDRIWQALWPSAGGWLRFAPGYMDATILLFNLRAFVQRWGVRGIRPSGTMPRGYPTERHYGLCQKLTRHRYLRPFHTSRYGLGNLLTDGETNVLWHSWYGSHRERTLGHTGEEPVAVEPRDRVVRTVVEDAEHHFLEDYPNLDLAGLQPAWWPEADIEAETAAAAARDQSGLRERLRTLLRRFLESLH